MTTARSWLALDLATRAGWAFGAGDGRPFRFGTWVLPSGARDPAETWAGLMEALTDIFAVMQPTDVVIEAPLLAQASNSSQNTAVLLMGLASTARLFCYWRDIQPVLSRPGDVRKALCGNYYAKKPEIVSWCRARGYDVVDDNAADALLLLHHIIRPTASAWPISPKRRP